MTEITETMESMNIKLRIVAPDTREVIERMIEFEGRLFARDGDVRASKAWFSKLGVMLQNRFNECFHTPENKYWVECLTVLSKMLQDRSDKFTDHSLARLRVMVEDHRDNAD